MFDVEFKPEATEALRRIKKYHAAQIVDAIESHLRHEPERPSRGLIKRLRGRQDAAYRLRVGNYRVFYDVEETTVFVIAILHKQDTYRFYRTEDTP
jgi:mRNA interferase RelE/StbE